MSPNALKRILVHVILCDPLIVEFFQVSYLIIFEYYAKTWALYSKNESHLQSYIGSVL